MRPKALWGFLGLATLAALFPLVCCKVTPPTFGDAQAKTSKAPEVPIRRGEPIWVTATIWNTTGKPLTTIRPDCFNTVFVLKAKQHEQTVYPSCRLKTPYDIPDDLVTLPPQDPKKLEDPQSGAFRVTCNLADYPGPIFPPERLSPGAVYRVEASYRNDIEDPDLTKDGCRAPDGQCYDLWTGTLPATPTIQDIRIDDAPPVVPEVARVQFDPDTWDLGWTTGSSPRVRVQITGIDVKGVDSASVRLNGSVPILTGTESGMQGDSERLTVYFDGRQSLQSLGTPVPGVFYATVQGRTPRGYFTATRRVTLAHGTTAP